MKKGRLSVGALKGAILPLGVVAILVAGTFVLSRRVRAVRQRGIPHHSPLR